MLLSELLETIPSDTEERVRRTRDRLNQQIREILRQETGFRLRRAASERGEQLSVFEEEEQPQPDTQESVTVRVNLVPGSPFALKGKEIEDQHRLAAMIAPWRVSLESLRDSGGDVEKLAAKLLATNLGMKLVEPGLPHLQPVIQLAERLLRETQKFNLASWILEVDEDVLGAYFYPVPQKPKSYRIIDRRQPSWIELYWGVIGLLARLLGIDVEDLTIVVLAHELAHAYTHLGTDIDGRAWTSEDFQKTEHALKEGLAQYYGYAVCQRLQLNASGAKSAFDRLLPHQPGAYQSHVPWVEKKKPD